MRIWAMLFCLVTPSVFADWSLDANASSLHFISTKNDNIAEIHTFDQLQGSVAGTSLSITVPLSSVNTIIPIRNERMQSMLFDLANHPTASFSATIDPALLAQPVGSTSLVDIAGDLAISGVSIPTTFSVRVSQLAANEINVATIKPTVITTGSFKLNDGIEALRAIAMLNVISQAVPITFNVTFKD